MKNNKLNNENGQKHMPTTLNCRQYFFAGLTSKLQVCARNLLWCSATMTSNKTTEKILRQFLTVMHHWFAPLGFYGFCNEPQLGYLLSFDGVQV